MTENERALLLSTADAVYALLINAIASDDRGLERLRDDVAAMLAAVESDLPNDHKDFGRRPVSA